MQWISNAREMRELDRSAIGERGIPSTRLMEAAPGRGGRGGCSGR